MPEHFTPLTIDYKTGVVSDEDIAEIWEATKQEPIDKARRKKSRTARAESPMIDEEEVEKCFCLSTAGLMDGW